MSVSKKIVSASLAICMVFGSGGIVSSNVFDSSIEASAITLDISNSISGISPMLNYTSTNTEATITCVTSKDLDNVDFSKQTMGVYSDASCTKLAAPKIVTRTSKSGKLEVTISNLKPNTSYTYYVQCTSKYGIATTKSNIRKITVKTTAKYSQTCTLPNLRVVKVTNNSATLAWDSPSKTMTNFNGYIKNGSSYGKYVTYVDGSKRQLTITGLEAGKFYTLGVKGWNTNSYGTTNIANITLRTAGSTANGKNVLMLYGINQLGGGGNSGSIRAEFGCGGTSLTMLMNSQKGTNYSKDTILKYQYAHGIFNNGDGNRYGTHIGSNFTWGVSGYGTCMQDIYNLAKAYGYTGKYIWGSSLHLKNNVITEIDEQLNKGHLVIVGMKKGSSTYHYEVVYGKQGSNYLIWNPYGNARDYSYQYPQTLYNSLTSAAYGTYTKYVQGIFWLE